MESTRKYCDIEDNCKLLKQMQSQYDAVVNQNRSLQTELNQLRKIKNDVLNDPLNLREVLLMNCIADDITSKYENKIRERIIEFLKEMSSQDNRGTAFPYIYTIADEHERFEADDSGDFFYDSNSGSCVEVAKILREEFNNGNIELEEDENFEEILSEIGSCFEDDRIDTWLRNYNKIGIQRYSKEYDTYYEGVFFTKTDAEAYLESTNNHHFGSNPRTYVDSMNKWGRHSKTEAFLADLFSYFGVKIPPKMYYENKKKEEKGEKKN